MYACGPTVYDKTHIGHMRKYIGDEIIRRTLSLGGYTVNHVMNITDVGHLVDDDDSGEDKLEKGAKKQNKTVWDIAAEYIEYFHNTMRAVNVLPPTHETKATDHIPAMIALVETLLAKGFAYETMRAVYFDTSKYTAYGVLSGQKLSDKETAVRDDVVDDREKRNAADFSLWFKCVGRFADHSMHWDNPQGIEKGQGFPGWHIECSAMSMQYLGSTIDIHTGGIDHIPVHHENEIAQSCSATDKDFVHYWVHHDFLNVDGEKMSKSKENFYTIEDIRARGIDPRAVRLLCMQTSYRKPLNFTWDGLLVAEGQLKKLVKFAAHQKEIGSSIQKYNTAFIEALCDDINTAKALATLWELMGDTAAIDADKWATLLYMDKVIGLDLTNTPAFSITPDAQMLVDARNTARANKDFATSDTLRAELISLGYEVLDTPEGTKLY
jgi:cysteinyl-tRNA synthetase